MMQVFGPYACSSIFFSLSFFSFPMRMTNGVQKPFKFSTSFFFQNFAMNVVQYSHSYSDSLKWNYNLPCLVTALTMTNLSNNLSFCITMIFFCRVKSDHFYFNSNVSNIQKKRLFYSSFRRGNLKKKLKIVDDSKGFTILSGCRPRLTVVWKRNIQVNYSTWSIPYMYIYFF